MSDMTYSVVNDHGAINTQVLRSLPVLRFLAYDTLKLSTIRSLYHYGSKQDGSTWIVRGDSGCRPKAHNLLPVSRDGQ